MFGNFTETTSSKSLIMIRPGNTGAAHGLVTWFKYSREPIDSNAFLNFRLSHALSHFSGSLIEVYVEQ